VESPISVLVVEDHPVMLEGLQLALVRDGFKVVGAATTAQEGVRIAAEHKPQVAVLDFNLPDADGSDLAQWIHQQSSDTAVIFLTADERDAPLLAALEAGARGYLFKTQPYADIAAAIRQAARGQSVMPPGRVSEVLGRERDKRSAEERLARERERLTPRELEILVMVSRGAANKEIARDLHLSLATVRWYVQQAIEKLETHSKIEAVVRARELGLLD
jgi:DNA-binding NarL/FixJ family response regulator